MSSSGTLKRGEALGALTYLYQEAQKLQPINCETISGQDHANFMSGITLRGWSSEFILCSFDLPWGFLIFRVYFCAALAITLSWLMWQTWHFTTCVCFCFSKEHFVRSERSPGVPLLMPGKNQSSLDSHFSISGSMLDSQYLREMLGLHSYLRRSENQFSFLFLRLL